MSATFRVILADDEPQVRSLFKRLLLRTLPFIQIIEATNGQEALDLYDQHGADLIVTDDRMPILDGKSFARTLRARQDAVPIVIVSGFLQPQVVLDGLDVAAWLEKPAAYTRIGQVVAELLPTIERSVEA